MEFPRSDDRHEPVGGKCHLSIRRLDGKLAVLNRSFELVAAAQLYHIEQIVAQQFQLAEHVVRPGEVDQPTADLMG